MKINLSKGFLLISLCCLIYCQQERDKSSSNEGSSSSYSELPVTTNSQEALVEFNKGLQLFDLYDFQNARKHFDAALELDPNFASGYVYRSWCSGSSLEFSIDVQSANSHTEGISDAEKLLVELDNAYWTSDKEKEMEVSKKLVALYPEVARAHSYLGIASERMGNYPESRKHFKKAVEIAPSWAGSYALLANSYIFNDPKDFDLAEQNMLKVVELQPKMSGSYIGLGDCYRANQDLEKALESYAEAILVNPMDPVAHSKAGHANTFMGHFDAARKNFQSSRKLSEYKANDLNFEAYTYLYEGDPDRALSWLMEQTDQLEAMDIAKSRISSVTKTNLETCAMIAMHHNKKEQLAQLIQSMEPLATKIGEEAGVPEVKITQMAEMLGWKSTLAMINNQFDKAEQLAEQMKATLEPIKDPRKLEYYNSLKGQIALRKNQAAEAIPYLMKADLNEIYPKYLLAQANEKSGNSDEANRLYAEIANYNFNTIGYALVRKEILDKLGSV